METVLNRIIITAPDTPGMALLAEQVKDSLSRYRIPKDVAEKTGIKSLSEVEEPWLIVICTPDTPKDPDVNARIDGFIAQKRFRNILTLLAAGSASESFPESLIYEKKEDGSIVEHEPLAANITAETEKERIKLLETEKLRLVAPVLGVAFDDLANRRRKARTQKLLAAGIAALAVSGAFLAFSLFRMSVISRQNTVLSGQYEAAETARNEAERQKEAAARDFYRTVALQAEADLDKGDTEEALSKAVKYLPEAGEADELNGIMGKTLETICAGGYVQVTDKTAYLETRGLQEEDELPVEKSVWTVPPPELETEDKFIGLDRRASSEEFGFAVYGSSVSVNGTWFSKICFPEEPEKDYFLRDNDGNLLFTPLVSITRGGGSVVINNCTILQDGSMIDIRDGRPFRVDILTGEEIPFFDEEGPEGSLVNDEESCFRFIYDYEGTDVILARTKYNTVEVWNRKPFRYQMTLTDIMDVTDGGFSDYIIGETKEGLAVFTRSPFAEQYRIEDRNTASMSFEMTVIKTARCEDGQNYLSYGWYVYDLNTGAFLYDFYLDAQAVHVAKSPLISSEGLMVLPAYHGVTVLDPETDTVYGRVHASVETGRTYKGNCELYGPENPDTKSRSASAILLDGIVYEFRQARQVPEDTQSRIALAEELLKNRCSAQQEDNSLQND